MHNLVWQKSATSSFIRPIIFIWGKRAFEELGNCQGKYLLQFIIRDKNITSQYSQVRTQRVISAKVMLVTLWWWQFEEVGGRIIILVTFSMWPIGYWPVTNFSKLSRAKNVSNIRQQHRCSCPIILEIKSMLHHLCCIS